MKETVFVKRIDELGRIVVPREIRRVLGVSNLESVRIYTDGANVMIKKAEDSCEFCKSVGNLTEFKGKFICQSCKNELTEA